MGGLLHYFGEFLKLQNKVSTRKLYLALIAGWEKVFSVQAAQALCTEVKLKVSVIKCTKQTWAYAFIFWCLCAPGANLKPARLVMFSWIFLPLNVRLLYSRNKTQGQFPRTQKHQNNTSQKQVKRFISITYLLPKYSTKAIRAYFASKMVIWRQ